MNMENPEFDIENVPEFIRPYFEAKKKGTLPQYYLNIFKHVRDNYLDDLPKDDVRTLATLDEKGNFIINNYKCLGNSIVGLAVNLSGSIEDGAITDPELIRKIEDFKKHDFRYVHGEFTTQEEIDMINQILADVIQYLEQ
ncbi:hypothetical protein A2229_04045 [Candidatus Peregrinibacteria bacterium RIFOXYA2_FULL_33_7]|nr:MAG: hypothetical protein UR30_C0015G0027 [Candidatus Peregrinibacteria bacterium GW2011_GWC2_33_13]OGJ50624.1 MAG: hypothetical protein A2229_04045 [Candidatus Peregrinibacteria bacterium RIFOXYA2_FULL_33_7]